MRQSLAILKLNLILLFKDKISLLWGLLLPAVMLILNIHNIHASNQLVYWWTYIFFNSFIYGVGLYALNEKDSGSLIFIYSIKWINFRFFFGCVLTQIVYGIACMLLFNVLAAFLLNYNFLTLCLYALLSLLLCIPVAFISYNLTFIKSLYSSSINSICNILIFSMFIMIGFETKLNEYNPLYKISTIQVNILNGVLPLNSIVILILLLILSIPSIYFFKPISIESR